MLLNEIDAFVQVASAGSFSLAARRLSVPKSTLSRAISRLEDAVGVRLFERSTRSLRLTDAGRAFFAGAQPHTAGLRDAIDALSNEREQPSGTLRLTAAPDAGELLSVVVVPFTARFPSLRVEVELSTRVVNLVAEGFDAALRASSQLRDASLMARLLARTDLHLFAAPAYLARRGSPSEPDELTRHDCVLFRAQAQEAEWKLVGPNSTRSVKVPGRIDCNEFPFMRAALVAGAGIGYLPGFFAREEVAAGRLLRVLPTYCARSARLYFVYPRARHVPKRVLLFRDFLFEQLAGKF